VLFTLTGFGRKTILHSPLLALSDEAPLFFARKMASMNPRLSSPQIAGVKTRFSSTVVIVSLKGPNMLRRKNVSEGVEFKRPAAGDGNLFVE